MMYPFSANPLCVLATGDCPFNLERTSTCPKHLIVYFRLDNVQPEAGDCWEEACESEVRRISGSLQGKAETDLGSAGQRPAPRGKTKNPAPLGGDAPGLDTRHGRLQASAEFSSSSLDVVLTKLLFTQFYIRVSLVAHSVANGRLFKPRCLVGAAVRGELPIAGEGVAVEFPRDLHG
jgi:hypothetical protein